MFNKNYLSCLGLFICFSLVPGAVVQAETPQEWVRLGKRVHGGFGTYIALGIRIGLDAMDQLAAKPRELDVTYQDGPDSPCPCVADGIMIATVATPGQNSLRVLPTKTDSKLFGAVVVKNQKTGKVLRYTIPISARKLLDTWNQKQPGSDRYNAVMSAPPTQLFHVEPLPNSSIPAKK